MTKISVHIFLGIAILAFAPCGSASAAATSEGSRTLRRELDKYLQSQVSRGFSGAVLVAHGNDVLLAAGYGYANAEWQIRSTAQTRFRIASLTKSFTATAIMLLREQRKLDLGDSVCKYVQPCPATWQAITMHHLLSNSSGIPNYFWGTEPDRQSNMTREQILSRMRDKPLEFPPGVRFEYGNSSWYLLAIVIEKVTGKSYEQAMRDLILAPLEMSDTGQDDRDQILARRASGYLFSANVTPPRQVRYSDVSWVIGAASMYSTVEDLYKFAHALNEGRLLSAASRSLMWTSLDLPWMSDRGRYGYGWWVFQKSDVVARPVVKGTGGMDAFMSALLYFPEDAVTIVVLQNSVGGELSIEIELERRVFESLDPSK